MVQKFMRRRAVEHATGLPRSTLYDLIDRNKFPKPIRIGERAVAWLESEIEAWQKARIAERGDAKTPDWGVPPERRNPGAGGTGVRGRVSDRLGKLINVENTELPLDPEDPDGARRS